MGSKIAMKTSQFGINKLLSLLLLSISLMVPADGQDDFDLTLEWQTPGGTWQTITDGTLDFGPVDCHATSKITCRFRNTGTGRFRSAGVRLLNLSEHQIDLIIPDYDSIFDPGDEVTFEIAYTPKQRMDPTQVLVLTGEYRLQPGSPYRTSEYARVPIDGTGLCAELEMRYMGEEIDIHGVPHHTEPNHFGPLRPNEERLVRTFEFYNVPGPDAVPLNIIFPRITGEHEDEFELIGLEESQIVPIGGSLSFDLAFEPDSLGDKEANLEFFANTENLFSRIFRLRGSGGLPEITVEEATSDRVIGNGALLPPPEFVFEAEEGSSSTKLFTIRNPGTGPLTINSVSVGGDFAFAGFTVAGISFPHVMEPSDSETFRIEFTPTRTSFQVVQVTISNDSPDDSPFIFPVGGRVRGPEMDVLGKPNNILVFRPIDDESTTPLFNNGTDFGSVEVGIQDFRTYRIDNPGDEDLILTPRRQFGGAILPLIFGPGADAFTASSSLPDANGENIRILPGEFYEFSIFFDPVPGLQEATFAINSNDSSEGSYRFAIQGTGTVQTEPDIDVFGINSLDKEIRITDGDLIPDQEVTQFGTAPLSTGITRLYRITNSGTDTLNIDKVTSSLDDFIIGPMPKSLDPGTSKDFEITFTPESIGEQQALISIQSDDPDSEGTYLFSVTGTGSSNKARPFAINSFKIIGGEGQLTLTLVPDEDYRLVYNTSLSKIWNVVPGYESLTSASGNLILTIPAIATLNKELPVPQKSIYFRLEEIE